ncbi:MAG: prephenate dehydratase [Pyrinomonadaceae bacterium]|nr:prephenate dehydratase [Pyrinomonadaceae bacterium]
MSSSRTQRVAFQGEQGAFSEDAALKLLGPEIQLVPRRTFEALFRSVDEGLADYVLVPVENSLIGAIQPAVDLLNKSSLGIVGEVAIQIRQLLIGCSGAVFEQISAVESHPAALAQCGRFFAAHTHIRRIETEDTAGSVARIVQVGDRTRAAIAGRRAAEVYGGSILREGLEDRPENFTRFLLLSGQDKSNGQQIEKSKFDTNHVPDQQPKDINHDR